jgi:hypothetical protein
MRRREFIGWVGAAPFSITSTARAQKRVFRIGVLLPGKPDSDYGDYFSSFVAELTHLG